MDNPCDSTFAQKREEQQLVSQASLNLWEYILKNYVSQSLSQKKLLLCNGKLQNAFLFELDYSFAPNALQTV